MKPRPAIKIVHLLLSSDYPVDIPEAIFKRRMQIQEKSIECFQKIAHGVSHYVQSYSFVNRDELPIETCAEPGIISFDFNISSGQLSYGHYGCYKAHRRAILEEFNDDIDALIVVEGDALFSLTPEEMLFQIYNAYEFCIRNEGNLFTFAKPLQGIGSRSSAEEFVRDYGEYNRVDHFLLSQCYMVMKNERERIKEKILTTKWHTWDIWLYWNYDRQIDAHIYAVKEPLIYELGEASMIDYKDNGITK